MAKSLRMDATTTGEVLAQTTASGKLAALRNAMGTGTQTVSVKNASAVEVLTGTFAGTAYTTVGTNFLPQTALASVSGSGGSATTDWTCRVTNAGGRWIEGSFGTGEIFSASGTLSSSGTTSLKISIGSELPPATPPGPVADWILQSTDQAIQVPADFLGLHSDYAIGSSRPVNPSVGQYVGTVRSLDYYPDSIYAPMLSWWEIEKAQGVYTWTYMDKWVAANTGKTFIWILDRTPSFYQKSSESTSYNRYPSYPGSSAPPSDGTKALNVILAILAKYPNERFIIELGNEHNYNWTSSSYDERWSDAWAEANIANPDRRWPFSSATPRTIANLGKTIRQGLNSAGYGPSPSSGKYHVLLLTPGWEGQYTDSGANSFKRFSQCPTDGGGVGADWVDGVAFHVYSYNLNESSFLGTKVGGVFTGEAPKYIQRAIDYGYGSKPVYCTEIGHEDPNGNSGPGSQLAYNLSDAQQATIIERWAYQAAALGVKTLCLYKANTGLDEEARTLKFYATENTAAKIASNTSWRTAMSNASHPNGRLLTQGARLADGRTWVAFSDGTTKVR